MLPDPCGNSTNEVTDRRLPILDAVTRIPPTASPAPATSRAASRRREPVRRRVVMSRRRFLEITDDLIATGEGLLADPDWNRFRMWLVNSDELLERVWGRMDRYHLAWLNVGRGSQRPGTALDEAGTRRFVTEVSDAKLNVLRTMREAVRRNGWTLLSDDDDADDDNDDHDHDDQSSPEEVR